MATLEELRARARDLRASLREVEIEINQMMIDTSPIEIGDLYERTGRGETLRAKVISKHIRYGIVVGELAVFKKNGAEGLRRSDTTSWNRWRRVEESGEENNG